MSNAPSYDSLVAELRRCRELAAALQQDTVCYLIDMAILEAEQNTAEPKPGRPREDAPDEPKGG